MDVLRFNKNLVEVATSQAYERIVKLLETDIEQCEIWQQGVICQICDGKREAIEIIKGDK